MPALGCAPAARIKKAARRTMRILEFITPKYPGLKSNLSDNCKNWPAAPLFLRRRTFWRRSYNFLFCEGVLRSAHWMRRELLKNVRRIVVKLGTGVLTNAKKQPDLAQMEQLVDQVARQRAAGREVALVSSGAVGAGMGVLGHSKRPSELAELQACAAVGQSRLMSTYEKLFSKHDLNVAQVLLTHADLEHHERHLNARNTLVRLLEHGVAPIINENDAVSFTEIKFGDNDKLSALVACLLPADLLVILTTVDGVIENFGKSNARVLPLIEEITD